MDVSDIFKANSDNLWEVYKVYFTQIKKYMEIQDCFYLCNRDTTIGATEKEVNLCFGMSKMTLTDEAAQYDRYHRLQFSEFFEFLGRIAHIKCKANIDWTYAQKVEYILDDIFAAFKLERYEAEVEVIEISESDNDYWI